MSHIKDFFDPTAVFSSDMQTEAVRSSSGAMNSLTEDPELSFPSSQSNFFISSSNSQMSSFVNDLSFYQGTGGGYVSTSSEGVGDGGGSSFIYGANNNPTEPHHHFMSPNGTFTTTPSPTSSVSSCSLHNNSNNFGGGDTSSAAAGGGCGSTGIPMYGAIGENEYATTYGEYVGRSDCAMERSARGYEIKCEEEYYNNGGHNPSNSSGSSSHSAASSLVTQQRNPAAIAAIVSFVGHDNHRHHNHRHTSGEFYRNGSGSSSSGNIYHLSSSAQMNTTTHGTKKQPRITMSREKTKKKCSNCHAINSPSWRRSIAKHSKGDLLCNACGLYEKTAKKKRMLVTADDGNTKVVRKRDARDYCCSTCGAKDATRWRRLHDTIQCEKCSRAQRSHK